MAFGQASGPPANARRLAELADLLAARGYDSFREARHPFGLNQRQAGGKFTVSEVDELIAHLEDEAEAEAGGPPLEVIDGPAPTVADPAAERKRRRQEEQVVGLDAEVMATELTNRGWCCIPPTPSDGTAPG